MQCMSQLCYSTVQCTGWQPAPLHCSSAVDLLSCNVNVLPHCCFCCLRCVFCWQVNPAILADTGGTCTMADCTVRLHSLWYALHTTLTAVAGKANGNMGHQGCLERRMLNRTAQLAAVLVWLNASSGLKLEKRPPGTPVTGLQHESPPLNLQSYVLLVVLCLCAGSLCRHPWLQV
jgi:hypothetical protein